MANTSFFCTAPCCLSFFIFLIIIPFAVALQRYSLYKKIRDVPTSKARSAALGLAEFFGKARCVKELYSPLSNQKCVYYFLCAEYYLNRGRHSKWVPIYILSSLGRPEIKGIVLFPSASSGKSLYTTASSFGAKIDEPKEKSKTFYLEDETGRILINLEDAEIDIPPDKVYTGYIRQAPIFGFLQKKMEEDGIKAIETHPELKAACERFAHQYLRISEFYIAEGDEIYTLGTVETKEEAGGTIGSENLVVKKGRDGIMYVSDRPERKILDGIKNQAMIAAAIGIVILLVFTIFVLPVVLFGGAALLLQ